MAGGYPGISWDVCNGTDIGTDTANSRGTALTATRGSYGSYTQLIASTAADAGWCELAFTCGTISNNGGAVKLAVGGAGSEKDILVDLTLSTFGSLAATRVSFPICIPAGTRVSAAAQCFNAGGETAYYVNAQLYDGGFGSNEGIAGYDSVGFNTANAVGTVITASATPNTKGSYTQLIASTPRDYCGIFIGPDMNTAQTVAQLLLDIAIGAGGSEVVIVPNWSQPPFSDKMARGFVPVSIPAGTRIAARCQSPTASATIGLSLITAYQ